MTYDQIFEIVERETAGIVYNPGRITEQCASAITAAINIEKIQLKENPPPEFVLSMLNVRLWAVGERGQDKLSLSQFVTVLSLTGLKTEEALQLFEQSQTVKRAVQNPGTNIRQIGFWRSLFS